MLFGCSPCCSCEQCNQGTLPESVTLTIDGFANGATPGKWLCPLTFSACYGTGAEASVSAPGGNAATDKGPITAVQVTKGGSGYAKIGRVAPTVTVTSTSGSGDGATFAVTLASSKDACGVDRWAVSKVVQTGGTGYQNGDQLQFTVAEGDTQEAPAEASIADAIYAEPTLSLSASGGTGAVLQINGYTKISTSWGSGYSDAWRISGITVANGGTGYTNDTSVTVTLGQDDEARPNAGTDLRVRTVFAPPTGAWAYDVYDQSFDPSGGSGIDLSITLSRIPSSNNWRATAVSIVSGGTGYSVGDIVLARLTTSSGLTYSSGLEVTAVDQDGAITGLTFWNRGSFPGTDTGVVESVVINSQAGWRKVLANPDGVLVTNGGIFYREDANAPAYVSPVTISVTQTPPSAGTGASLSAVIDNVPSSETFGQITAVNVGNGGNNYLAYEWCEANLQGTTVVLPRTSIGAVIDTTCQYYKEDCGRSFRVHYRGASLPPRVILTSVCNFQSVQFELNASENVTNCSQMAFTASDSIGRSASVTAGGVPSGTGCNDCTGHVLVNGVAVPLNIYGIQPPGNYTLVSVDPASTLGQVAGPGQRYMSRYYGVAQAVNMGCVNWRGEPEMSILLYFWIIGFTFTYPLQSELVDLGNQEFDQLTVGSVRASNPVFAGWNVFISGLSDIRSLGPIRGNNCIGNEWHLIAWQGDVAAPDPPTQSWFLSKQDTRQTERGTVQCGPI